MVSSVVRGSESFSYGTTPSEKRRAGVLVSRIASPYPGANHVAPHATKYEKEYRTRSPPRRIRRSSGSSANLRPAG